MTYDSFLKAIGDKFDLDWRKYRRHGARRNLDRRLAELKLPDYSRYLKFLDENPMEAEQLPDLLRITVSRFFRERDCWRELAERILPELHEHRESSAPLKSWSVGCCNGEEPYSLALLLLSETGSIPDSGRLNGKVKIMATDIDEAVLARAAEACYQKSSLRELPAELLMKYFHPASGRRLCVDELVKGMVSLEQHNLMQDPPFVGMDLVLCRYLAFTYYLGERRLAAATRLWEALKPGGALMVGRKDTLGQRELELFEPWPGTEVFFRRRKNRGLS